MKKLPALFWLACLLIAGCSTKKLSSEESLQLLRESDLYPRVLDFDIYCSDPQQAQAILAAGLEKEGLVTIQKTHKLGEVGKPLIAFTAKAESYLLPATEKEKELEVQKVKLAEEELLAVTNITPEEDSKSAVVEYNILLLKRQLLLPPYERTRLRKKLPGKLISFCKIMSGK